MNATQLTSPAPTDGPLAPGPAAPQPARITLTSDGAQLLRAKIELLRRELAEDYAVRLKEARTFGEAAGNDEYLQIKEEEALLVRRIHRLQEMLDTATVIERTDYDPEQVTVGSTVEVEDLDSGAISEHRLYGGFEDRPAGVSVDSPVGRSLLGRRPGERVEVTLPRGRQLQLRVVAVSHPETANGDEAQGSTRPRRIA